MRNLPLPLIRRLTPLNGLSDSSLQSLLEQSEWPLLGRGQTLFTAAELERFYIYLLSGEARLSYAAGSLVHTAEESFPMGYGLSGLQSAIAVTDCVCLRVEKNLLDRLLCWDHVAAAIELDLSYQAERDEEASWRLTLLKSNLFLKVPPLNINQIFSRLRPMQVSVGDVILRQGDVGDGCYFIRRGRAKVTRLHAGETEERHIVDIGYGRCFGEDALVYDTVRNASVTMISDGLLARLDKADFMLLLREPPVEHVKATEIDAMLTAGARLLDVRLPEEFDIARMPTAINAPLAYLPLLMATQLDAQDNYIVYCDSGRRSCAAVSLLQQKGFKASYLLNGIDGLTSEQREKLLDIVPPLSPMPDMALNALEV